MINFVLPTCSELVAINFKSTQRTLFCKAKIEEQQSKTVKSKPKTAFLDRICRVLFILYYLRGFYVLMEINGVVIKLDIKTGLRLVGISIARKSKLMSPFQ